MASDAIRRAYLSRIYFSERVPGSGECSRVSRRIGCCFFGDSKKKKLVMKY